MKRVTVFGIVPIIPRKIASILSTQRCTIISPSTAPKGKLIINNNNNLINNNLINNNKNNNIALPQFLFPSYYYSTTNNNNNINNNNISSFSGIISQGPTAFLRKYFITSTNNNNIINNNNKSSTSFSYRTFTTKTPINLCPNNNNNNINNNNNNINNSLMGTNSVKTYTSDEDNNNNNHENPYGNEPNKETAYLPFPPPFHTINIVMVLFLANILFYLIINFCGNDDIRDIIIEHFTLSHENAHKIYPFFTSSLYQENLFQLLIDCWLLYQFGNSVLGFLGGRALFGFWAMTSVGGGIFHLGRQYFELYYGIDILEVRGRVYGPNPFILGLVAVEGLIFRHLNFMQNPPVPFLVITAFVMIIDIWRIFTTRPEEHGAPTGGALVAYVFWALPVRYCGLSRLTASL